jgi:hypothetical protein
MLAPVENDRRQLCLQGELHDARAMLGCQRITYYEHRTDSSFRGRCQGRRNLVWTLHGEGADLQARIPGGGLGRFCLERRAGIRAIPEHRDLLEPRQHLRE